jgi:hypothetical protein
MDHQVKIKARPGQEVRFPGICVACEQPAAERMRLTKRAGQTTRTIDVPLCSDCARQMVRRSAGEERLQTFGWLAGGLAGALALALTLLLAPEEFGVAIRLPVALLVAALAFAAVWLLFRRLSWRAAAPEKKAIRDAARIEDFSWRATTFTFQGAVFTERFRALNELTVASEE